jgi:hypothetical protein
MTGTRLIVGLITHIVIYLTVTKPVREAKAQLWAVVPLMMMKYCMLLVEWDYIVMLQHDIVKMFIHSNK